MYLYRFRLNDSPVCPEYGSASENPEHNIFCCPRFCSEKRGLKNLANHYYYYYINLGWAENSQKKIALLCKAILTKFHYIWSIRL